MSKDIWHKADEAPRYRFQCVYYHRDSKEYYFGEYDPIFRTFMGKKTFSQCEVWKFAFAEDIISCLGDLERTRKALDVAVNALNKIANTDIKVIEKEPFYYARAMFSVTNNALGRIQYIKQKDVK